MIAIPGNVRVNAVPLRQLRHRCYLVWCLQGILALNVASNFLRDLVISVLHPLRQSRTLHTLTFGLFSGGLLSNRTAPPHHVTM